MNKINKAILNILSASINGHLEQEINLTNEEWEALFQEACSHQIHLVIYPTCKKLIELNAELSALSEHWRNVAVISSLQMNTKLSDMYNVFKSFQDHNIKVMVLKGLYFRELYPTPDSRTMGDVDLFVLNEDLETAISILLQSGYRKVDKKSTMHYSFEHKEYISIDLHYSIVSMNIQKSSTSINQTIWFNTDTFEFNNIECIIPSYMNHIVYCCLHMAKHFKSSGFGLRQLCDFALLVKNVDQQFNWELFIERADYYGIGKFTGALLVICNEYLSVDIPKSLLSILPRDNNYIQLLCDEILISGVFGTKSAKHATNKSLAKYKYNDEKNKTTSKLSYYFPSSKKLNSYYMYAKKNPFLLPIAWIHRLFLNLKRTDISLSAKTPDNEIINNHIRLLQWLEIK